MLRGNHPHKKLSALNQPFFLETECTFPTGANHPWDVSYWYTKACPHPALWSLLQGSKKETYQLFFSRHHGEKPWQKSDDLQTQGTACQQSGSIQSIHCFRGHFDVCLFVCLFCLTLQTLLGLSLWVIDTLQVLNYNTGSLHMQLSAHSKSSCSGRVIPSFFFKWTVIFRKVDVKASNFWLYYNCAVINHIYL